MSSGATKQIVLFVDDEAEIVETFTELFEHDQVELIGFTDANEALKYIESHTVTAVYCDFKMPGISGLDLASKVCDTVPVILTTGTITASVNDYPQLAGVLHKPLTVDDFTKSVMKVLKLND